nr:MAG TPA: hypothetical protein [Caudoviricetes sp.]
MFLKVKNRLSAKNMNTFSLHIVCFYYTFALC